MNFNERFIKDRPMATPRLPLICTWTRARHLKMLKVS